VILRRWPLQLLGWNDALSGAADVQLPAWLGGVKFPVRKILLVGFFHYHPRVLDAWVEQHVQAVQTSFKRRETYKARATYVPLPVVLNGEMVLSLTPHQIRSLCDRERWYVHIQGEGGAGKTTLACQLALWSMESERQNRLSDGRMLPVLIEPGLGVDVRTDVDALRQAARGQLQLAIGAAEPISDKLFERLLRTRRVLVILDGVSEMIRDPAAVDAHSARYENPEFPVNAMVVTARTEIWTFQQPDATVQPRRIDSNHLLPFMNAYLSQAGLALADYDIYDGCKRLAQMVGPERGITPLLARLYAEEMVTAWRQGSATNDLPRTIPDLMLSYLNTLNRHHGSGRPDNADVHRAIKVIAWECLKHTLGPGPAKITDVLSGLKAQEISPTLFTYIESELGLIRRIPPAETDVHFILHPLAEYLAGLYCVSAYNSDADAWRRFVCQADSMPSAPESIKGFLVALRDCCSAKQDNFEVPEFILYELDARIGLERTVPTAAAAVN
jgi:hypothetical protein